MLEQFIGGNALALAIDHREADLFAEPVIGDRERGTARHRRMPHRQILDLRRVDVVAAADDQILLTADDLQIAVRVEAAEIAAHEPARAIERLFGRLLVVEIAEGQARAAAADLADLAGRHLDIGVLLVPQPDLVGAAGLAAGRDDRLGRVARQGVLVRAVLAHAVDVLRCHAAVEKGLRDLARDRRPRHVEHVDPAEPP